MAGHYIDSLLGQREKIVHSARQHSFILARNIFAEIALIFLFFLGTIAAVVYLSEYASPAVIILIGFAVMLLPVATMTRDILVWTNRQFIVTNRRVMQISGVINKSVTDSSLEKVNDVKMEQTAFGRMFNYGDIEILTASELGVNIFLQIEKPIQFKTAMLNAKERLEHGDDVSDSEDITNVIAQLEELRKKGILSDEEFARKKEELLAKL